MLFVAKALLEDRFGSFCLFHAFRELPHQGLVQMTISELNASARVGRVQQTGVG